MESESRVALKGGRCVYWILPIDCRAAVVGYAIRDGKKATCCCEIQLKSLCYYRSQTKMWEGNVFAHVFVCPWGGSAFRERGICLRREQRGICIQGVGRPPPGYTWDMVNKPLVRSLLECFLGLQCWFSKLTHSSFSYGMRMTFCH